MTRAAQAQLGPNCTASIQNRVVQINPGGTFAIGNVPVDSGFFRVRVVCKNPDGSTSNFHSPFTTLVPNGETLISDLIPGAIDPIPVSLQVTAPKTTLKNKGETTQLLVIATLPDNTTQDLTKQSLGTSYSTSNASIATVSIDGLVTALSRGRVFIGARNEGSVASIALDIFIPNDTDGDGMTDEFEKANSLNPNDPTDAAVDSDGDGLINLQEFTLGTNSLLADTDGDGLSDSDEVRRGTDPLSADNDGDGLSDGDEVRLETDPVNPDTDGDSIPDGIEARLGLNPLVKDATTRVRGQVVDSFLNPVAGASAVAFNFFTGTTDATGFFNIPLVPATLGNIAVLARAIQNNQILDGSSPGVAAVPNGVTDVGAIQIGLNSGTVAGFVLDPLNRPVPNAPVRLSSSLVLGASRNELNDRMTTTDVTGTYRVTNVGAGSVTVTARDPRTGLQGKASGTLFQNQSATVDIHLGPSGTVAGTVFGRDQVTRAGAGVNVALSGSTSLRSSTDSLSKYLFDFVPLGSLVVEASDTAGNRGRTERNLSATGQFVQADITFLAQGTVTGTVTDTTGAPLASASVTLASQSVFKNTQSTTTDANGKYSLSRVFLGRFTVVARGTGLGGKADGQVDREGQTVTVNIVADRTAGTLTGTVFRHDRVTRVPGANVALPAIGLATTADSQGGFRFDLVPVGGYEIDAFDPSTGDAGRELASISAEVQSRNIDIFLNGLGQVTVEVRDGRNALVGGAQVTLTGRTVFNGSKSGITTPDGTITFERVFAGDFSVSATDPRTQLSGLSNGTVSADGRTTIMVQLQPSGSILGIVFAPDGVTPVPNFSVSLEGHLVSRQSSTRADGSFRFEIVPTGTYTLSAFDGAGTLRAQATNLALSTEGQELRRNLTLIGVGTVTGHVTKPDGTAATGAGVSVHSQTPGFGRSFFATADIDGVYTVDGVPVGSFGVSASQGQFFGAGKGQIAADGDAVTVDIKLFGALFDANDFTYNPRENGAIQNGTRDVFVGDSGDHRGALNLDLIADETSSRFSATDFASEQSGRQLVMRQSGLAGLNVTRKIFVPRDGYFARYLEILNNPSAAPITVDVKLTTDFSFIFKVQAGFLFDREPRIISTSSGDGSLDVSDAQTRDRWVEIGDDEDGDPFLIRKLPAVVHVFDGPNGAGHAGQAQFNLDFGARFGELFEQWQAVTVPPGSTVAFLHFVSQQTSRASAQASAERLVELPPEALAGLSAEEISVIQNFAVPPNGVSKLAPLPSLNGSVSGRVLASDNATVIPRAQVTYKSRNLFFGRTFFILRGLGGGGGTDDGGNFSFNSTFNDVGTSVAIPIDSFTLVATHPQTLIESPATVGTFVPPLLTATQDIVFSNSGIVGGTIRIADGRVVVSSGTVLIRGGALLKGSFVSTNIAVDGTYRFTGIPASDTSYTLVAQLFHPQGTPLTSAVTANVGEGQVVTADITIQTTGVVTGTVRRSNGDPLINLPVQLTGTNLSRTAVTDTGGKFTFSDVPTGTVTLETFEQASNAAASARVEVPADQTVTQDLVLSVGGSVAGLVTSPTGQPVSGVQVTLTAANGSFQAMSGGDGRYRVDGVAPGNFIVQAVDPVSGLRGRGTGSFDLSGQTTELNIQLFASGTVTGTIFHADGGTPAGGTRVSINLFLAGLPTTVTADSQGRYTFDLVPLQTFELDVTDPATGDRGKGTNQVNRNGEVRTVNVTLNGLGKVLVTVQDAANNPVANAQVNLSSQTQFGGTQSGASQANGTLSFDNVLVGNFIVEATDPVTQLRGSASGSVALGATTNITVKLQPVQPVGTIHGIVLAADGTTPVSGSAVRLVNVGQVTSATDGSFRFDNVLLGTYTLEALDSSGRLRARETGVTLLNNGDMVARNLTFLGLGTVSGTVLKPDGTVAPDLSVLLRSTNSLLGGFFNATTGADGQYEIEGIPVGSFTATASDLPNHLIGDTSGLIERDGQQVTADIHLLNNAINLPTTRFDANAFRFLIRSDGSASGNNGAFLDANFNSAGSQLFVVAAGISNRFTGANVGTIEQDGQQVVIRQQNLAGLDVTRKIFIPQTGYMARYLEILSNPSSSPITVNLNVTSTSLGFPAVIATSSGDSAVDVSNAANPDRWVVIDDQDKDPFLQTVDNLPALGFAFDGADASERVGTTSIGSANRCSFFGCTFAQFFSYQWNSVTIPPGGTAAYLHFAVQQSSRAAAQASAARLIQLPPEALTGLSPQEISAIRNFVVPADGVSALAPLPALNGTVNGLVLASDSVTPIPSAKVQFKSNTIFFSRTRTFQSDGNGAFSLRSTFNNFGTSIPVPIDAFTLNAVHPQTNIQSPDVTGDFPVDQTTATQNVVFTNTGIVRGIVVRHNGAAVGPGGRVQLSSTTPGLFLFAQVNLAADGSYVLTGLPAGEFALTAFIPHPQGSELTGTRSASVAIGQVTRTDIFIQPTGTVTGTVRTVRGDPASVFVVLSSPGFVRSTFSDGAGLYLFPDVPAGFYTDRAVEPTTGVSSAARVSVLPDQTTTQDLALVGLGTVQMQVNFASGSPAEFTRVDIQEIAKGSQFFFAGITDSAGALTIGNVPVGAFTVRAFHPNSSNLFTDVAGRIANDGDVVSLTVALPGTGVVSGQVTFADGAAAANAQVSLFGPNVSMGTQTDSAGNYTFVQIPVGRPFNIFARNPTNTRFFREKRSNTVAADGETLTVNLILPSLVTVRVTVLNADSTPLSGARIEIEDSFGQFFDFAGSADASGVLSIPNVPEGIFNVRASDPNRFPVGRASGTIALADQGKTIDVTINAQPSGNIRGTVFAADGSTPVASAPVEVLDAATGEMLDTTLTRSSGAYDFSGVAAGSQGFKVRAHSPADIGVVAEQTGTFTILGETVTINLTLPGSIIKGTVFFSDGRQHFNPSVFVTQTDATGKIKTFFGKQTPIGGYMVVGVPVGDFTITAQDPSSGLTGTATGTVTDLTVPVVRDVTLQVGGTVTGTVFDATNNVVPSAKIALSSGGLLFDRLATADAQGRYTLSDIALGPFVVQAKDPSTGLLGSATGSLSVGGETATVNVNLPATGTVRGTVFAVDGVTPAVSFIRVIIVNSGNSGPLGTFTKTVSTDEAGNYDASGVPTGTLQVSAVVDLAGSAEGSLTSSGPATIDVTLGNAVRLGEFDLIGTDGFKYDLFCDGELGSGGTVDFRTDDAYSGAYFLLLKDEFLDCAPTQTGRLEENGRQLAIGPIVADRLNITRKIFVPPTGGFARYLEILSNPTNTPISVPVKVESFLDVDPRIVVDPAATNGTFAVTDQSGFCCSPALGFVLGGISAPVRVSSAQFVNGNDEVFYSWNVTVLANQTVILMHFAIQRDVNDVAGAQAQAQSLVNLTDPNALVGMSAQEKSQVINFNIP